MKNTTIRNAALTILATGFILGSAVSASAAAILWLDAGSITGVGEGGTVDTWADSSTNGNDALRTNGSPTYHSTAGPNGQSVVRFDDNTHGTHDEFQVAHNAGLSLTNYTIFVVGLQTGTDWDTLLVKGGLPTSTAWNYLIAANGPSVYQAGANAQGKTPNGNADSVSNAGIGGSFGIIGHRADLTIAHLGVVTDTIGNFLNGNDVFKGGSSFGDPATDFTNTEPLFIGGGGSPIPVEGGAPFTGDLAEIAILPFTASDQQILDVSAYLGDKYGIAVAGGGNAANGLALIVPEPSGVALLVIGLVPLVARRRR